MSAPDPIQIATPVHILPVWNLSRSESTGCRCLYFLIRWNIRYIIFLSAIVQDVANRAEKTIWSCQELFALGIFFAFLGGGRGWLCGAREWISSSLLCRPDWCCEEPFTGAKRRNSCGEHLQLCASDLPARGRESEYPLEQDVLYVLSEGKFLMIWWSVLCFLSGVCTRVRTNPGQSVSSERSYILFLWAHHESSARVNSYWNRARGWSQLLEVDNTLLGASGQENGLFLFEVVKVSSWSGFV